MRRRQTVQQSEKEGHKMDVGGILKRYEGKSRKEDVRGGMKINKMRIHILICSAIAL